MNPIGHPNAPEMQDCQSVTFFRGLLQTKIVSLLMWILKILEMTSGKKFLSPILYPKDFSLEKKWFIKYQVEDWEKGGFKFEKYTGLLNRLNTVEERKQLALQYIAKMHAGEALESYQGMRSVPAKPTLTKQDTNIVVCCHRFLYKTKTDVTTGDAKPATYTQYKTKINAFVKWLQINNKEHLAIGGLSEVECEDFMTYLLLEKKLSNETYNAYKTLLGRIWAKYKKQLNGYNPWPDIARRKKKTKHLESYPASLQRHIEYNLPGYNNQLWIFMQCIFYCAIRPQAELRFLQIKHINFETGIFTVPAHLSKNGKERKVNVYRKLIEQLISHNYHLANPDDFIFSIKGAPGIKPVSKNFFSRRWDDFRKEHGIADRFKMYGSKHTAGKLISKKMNPYIAKEHFDHQSLATTQSYTDDLSKNELQFLQTEYPEFAA
jgi:integrase